MIEILSKYSIELAKILLSEHEITIEIKNYRIWFYPIKDKTALVKDAYFFDIKDNKIQTLYTTYERRKIIKTIYVFHKEKCRFENIKSILDV